MKLLDAILLVVGVGAVIVGLFQLGTMSHAEPIPPTPTWTGYCDTGEYLNTAGLCVAEKPMFNVKTADITTADTGLQWATANQSLTLSVAPPDSYRIDISQDYLHCLFYEGRRVKYVTFDDGTRYKLSCKEIPHGN